MARLGHPIHAFVLDRARVSSDEVLLDLGCGTGPTLAEAHVRQPQVRLIGFDASPDSITAAGELLGKVGAVADLRVVDLDSPLPLADGSLDAVVCHNVLECLTAPVDLMNEAHRVLRPGGIAVWSHTDFDTILVDTPDGHLSRAVLHAYADQPQPWMKHSDARMGRKIAGLARRSHLDLTWVDAHVLSECSPTPEVQDRLDDVVRSLATSTSIEPELLARWKTELDASVTDGSFFFAETTFVAVTAKP